ncbi:hypothetical protein KCU64_g18510, partial [Aureobasidium melanogenum]
MADQAQAAANAVQQAVNTVADRVSELTTGDNAAAPTLYLDEATGEKVSKTELKKRQKQREKEAKKAEKAATTTAPPAKKKTASAEEEEAHLNPNQYFEIRSRAIQKLRQSHEPNPYPHKFQVNYDLRKFEAEFGHLKSGEHIKEKTL